MKAGDRIVLTSEVDCTNDEFKGTFHCGTRRTLHSGAYIVMSVTSLRVRLADELSSGPSPSATSSGRTSNLRRLPTNASRSAVFDAGVRLPSAAPFGCIATGRSGETMKRRGPSYRSKQERAMHEARLSTSHGPKDDFTDPEKVREDAAARLADLDWFDQLDMDAESDAR